MGKIKRVKAWAVHISGDCVYCYYDKKFADNVAKHFIVPETLPVPCTITYSVKDKRGGK